MTITEQIIKPDIEHVDKISTVQMDEVNRRLKSGWVLLGITIERHARSAPEFKDEEFYIIGSRRAGNF